ncbi:metallophosphoesterase family protein [Singulisphaera rosea]
MDSPDGPVTFVIPGDLHLTGPGLENHRVAEWVVDEVNDLVRPDFVQFIGDNVQNAKDAEFLLFNRLRTSLGVHHEVLVGDHDVDRDRGLSTFREFVGEPTGGFVVRGFRFLRLDTQEFRPLGISPTQVAWFREQVDRAAAVGERIIVFQHNYPFQIWENFDGPGLAEWREVVQTRRVSAIFCGHTHYLQVANDGRNVTIATRSIGDPEGGPPGYLVVWAWGEDLAATFRSVEDRGPLVLVTHPREGIMATGPRHIVSGPDRLEVKVWSRVEIASVSARLDDGDWQDLHRGEHGLWTGLLPGDRLEKGRHSIEAHAVDANGAEGEHRIDFVVDPTGRYTAVPAAHPRVDRTSYC